MEKYAIEIATKNTSKELKNTQYGQPYICIIYNNDYGSGKIWGGILCLS